ncbi:MAG TPA: DMT family transporter [Steroidobacteraceae bacterium]|jgi:transporter family-2 protein|nr:DMT family transporter [Steroidobacteraceae bacterium]
MRGLAYFLGIVAGFGLTAQVGMNSKLRTVLQSANTAALISFLVGTTALIALLVGTRASLPTRETLATVPWWAWLGGLMGAFYVAISTVVAASLGTASLLGLTLLGQLATALVIDHYGWLGMAQHPITLTRLAGVALLGAGVWLITR